MLSTLSQLAPQQMKVRGLARLGLSKGLPASCPSPFICHDAFIRALSHLLAMLRGAGLPPAPPVGCPGSLTSELSPCLCSGEPLLHSCCLLNPFPARMSQADLGCIPRREWTKTALSGTLPCILSAQAAPVPTSPFCTRAAVCEIDTCSCHSRKLAVPPLVSLPVPLVTAARREARL